MPDFITLIVLNGSNRRNTGLEEKIGSMYV